MPSYELAAPELYRDAGIHSDEERGYEEDNWGRKTIREELRQKSSREVVEKKIEENCLKKC